MEERIKEIFFNESLKRWHFEQILKETGISRERTNYYLKKLIKECFIIKTKQKKRMPYYIANRELPKFRFEKRLYGLNLLEKEGFFDKINSLKGIKTAILFGSFSRGDWNKTSDVDLFIYGTLENFEKGELESKLKKEISILSYNNPKKIKKELDPKLIPNIFRGFNIKGNLEPFEVSINV